MRDGRNRVLIADRPISECSCANEFGFRRGEARLPITAIFFHALENRGLTATILPRGC